MSAEFAAALPAVVLLLALCLAALQLTTLQVRAQDAAAFAARVSARGDASTAAGYVTRLVPGARLAVERRGDLVCARVNGGAGEGPFSAVRIVASSCVPSGDP